MDKNLNAFQSYIWKSKIRYDGKNKLIKNLENNFIKDKNKFTPSWDCFVHSSFFDDDQKDIPEDLLDILQEKIKEFLNDCPQELKIKGKFVLSEIWYNIYEKNFFQEPHTHGQSLYSGCYYLKFNKHKHHQTTFYNPNFNINHIKVEQYSIFCFEPDCDEDDIIIFPSNLKHGTLGLREKNDDEIRITISFNIVNPDLCLISKGKGVSYN
jgi:uncharacterized protein (TIGR02466 family)|tara:strand:- start:122 stop:751 length:630 start_codon:yes stop_codon:yes gene_type:complete